MTDMTMAAASDDAAMLTVFERLALDAGPLIMGIFNADMKVSEKSDLSPVTEADRLSEELILAGLRKHFPDIPCVAEEEVSSGLVPASLGHEFFLVDPLDGTKEFINKRPDFTVNIALVRDGVPVVGIVYSPCAGRYYAGRPGHAEIVDVAPDGGIATRRPVAVRRGEGPYTIVASRSHRTPETDEYIAKIEAGDIVSVGSSLKFCLVASGEADVYPRFGRTMEWDTAAGDAVLRAAGGTVTTVDGAPLLYGKRNQPHDADFANPYFIASSGADCFRA
jgi:3'(2'), 5'-bisphosphate nucleotidase